MAQPQPYWFARVSPPGHWPNRIVPIRREGLTYFVATLVGGILSLNAGALLIVFGVLRLGPVAIGLGIAFLAVSGLLFFHLVRTVRRRTDPDKTYFDYREERRRARDI